MGRLSGSISRGLCLLLASGLQLADALSVASTVLIIGRDSVSVNAINSGFNGYGIRYETHVPKSASVLPALTISDDVGKYGSIVLLDEPLSQVQQNTLYEYQKKFGVRLVRLNATPSAESGTAFAVANSGCCDNNVEQFVRVTNTTGFPTAGLKTGASLTTIGLWHQPATITNSSIAWEFASFDAAGSFKSKTTAGVINNIGGREQMLWFLPFDTTWSLTSSLLVHSAVHWATRGLYAGYRRITFSTQVDDVFLITELYSPSGKSFRVRPEDLNAHIAWQKDFNAKLPAGSNYFVELAHNGNGNIEGENPQADNPTREEYCKPGPVDYPEQPDQTPATQEWKKPIGTGTDLWPKSLTSYAFTKQCVEYDKLQTWFSDSANRDTFAHLSHTFTHLDLTNATLADTRREINFNKAWMDQIGISKAKIFSPKGLVPPAITGLHNGDAIRAWVEGGISGVVGDNSRPKLLNKQNEYWPLITNEADDGYAGMVIMPRFATNFYYNCDKISCNVAEWRAVSKPDGKWDELVADAQYTNVRNLLALRRDPYMFHQANMRQTDVETSKVNGVTKRWSLLMIFAEVVVQELTRLVNWPIITLKHDDMVQSFVDRMTRDQCSPSLAYNLGTNAAGQRAIVSVTLSAAKNNCAAKLPVTLPGPVKSQGTATAEQIGSDPLTLWVPYGTAPVTFELVTPLVA